MTDVTEHDFQQRVVERSREVPVVVDFWAEWCGPCRTLGPALEQAVLRRDGEVELAKVDVDSNQQLAAAFHIQGIPAVKGFRDGEVVAEFVGAQPPAAIEKFLDELVPSEADRLAASDDEEELRRALEVDPKHAGAATALARILLRRGDSEEAGELLAPFASDFVADGLAARAETQAAAAGDGAAFEPAFSAWDNGNVERTLELLQQAVADLSDPEARDRIRRMMVAIFTELGADHPLAREHRRRLAAALN